MHKNKKNEYYNIVLKKYKKYIDKTERVFYNVFVGHCFIIGGMQYGIQRTYN